MLKGLIRFAVVVIAVVLSTLAAENRIYCTVTALLNVVKAAVRVVHSIDTVKKIRVEIIVKVKITV